MSEKIIEEEEVGTADQVASEETMPEESKKGANDHETSVGDVDAPVDVSEPEEPPSLEEQLKTAIAEAAQNLDGWMRAQAEFANARKRMEKQRAETYRNATGDVVSKLIPVLDDFARALDDVPDALVENSWLEGMRLVQRKLLGILDSLNVTPIQAVGQAFDPNFHEAIMKESTDEFESGVVTKVLQQGYQLGDRVIRPALVYVAE